MSTTSPASRGVSADGVRRAERNGRPVKKQDSPAVRLPKATGSRKPARVAIAVLLIVGGALGAAFLALRIDERVPMLVLSHPIQAGQKLSVADFAQTDVASISNMLVPAAQVKAYAGQYAAQALYEGQLLDKRLVTKNNPVGSGNAAVGAVFKAGQAPPTGLQAGDIVRLVRVSEGQSKELTPMARVWQVPDAKSSSGFFGGGSASSGAIAVTFAVPSDQAADVAAAAAEGTLAAVLVQRGESLPGAGSS